MKVVIAKMSTAEIDCGADTCDRCIFVERWRGEPYLCRFWGGNLTRARKKPETIKRLRVCQLGERVRNLLDDKEA